MNPKQFLIVGGIVLLALGIVGLAGVFPQGSFFWLTPGENTAHVFLGIVALAAVYVPGLNSLLEPYYKPIVILVGLIALFFGVYGFAVANEPPLNTFGVAQLNNPADNILHLVVAVWAMWAALRRQPGPAMAT